MVVQARFVVVQPAVPIALMEVKDAVPMERVQQAVPNSREEPEEHLGQGHLLEVHLVHSVKEAKLVFGKPPLAVAVAVATTAEEVVVTTDVVPAQTAAAAAAADQAYYLPEEHAQVH